MFIEKVKKSPLIIKVQQWIFAVSRLRNHPGKVIIALPMTLLVLYLAVFSHPRYVSESTVVVKRASDVDGSSLNVGFLLGASNPSSTEDALILKEYIQSPDMLNLLDKQLDFHKAFGQSGWDFFYHLPKRITAERFIDYYRNRIAVSFDDKSGLLTIQTQGFSPAFAQEFNKAVLKESERFINELSQHIARDQQVFAEGELKNARTRLEESKNKMLTFQNNNNMLDPQASAVAASTLVNTLNGQKIQMETELRNLMSYLREDAPQVVSAKNAIKSLAAQIGEEESKITAPEGKKLNSMAVAFEEIKARVSFDTDIYKLALTAIEKTRVESSHKLKTLAIISSPQKPEDSSYPDKLYLISCWFLVCSLLFGTTKLLIAVIDDHKD